MRMCSTCHKEADPFCPRGNCPESNPEIAVKSKPLREPMINRGSSKQTVIEWLLRPVISLMERRVRAIINSVVDLIPDKCPHCGKAIALPSEQQLLARQILRAHDSDAHKDIVVGAPATPAGEE